MLRAIKLSRVRELIEAEADQARYQFWTNKMGTELEMDWTAVVPLAEMRMLENEMRCAAYISQKVGALFDRPELVDIPLEEFNSLPSWDD